MSAFLLFSKPFVHGSESELQQNITRLLARIAEQLSAGDDDVYGLLVHIAHQRAKRLGDVLVALENKQIALFHNSEPIIDSF